MRNNEETSIRIGSHRMWTMFLNLTYPFLTIIEYYCEMHTPIDEHEFSYFPCIFPLNQTQN